MARIFKEVEITSTHRVLDSCTCDFCGRPINVMAEASKPGDVVDSVVLRHEKAERLPDGSAHLSTLDLDCCGGCAPKVMQALINMTPKKPRYTWENVK